MAIWSGYIDAPTEGPGLVDPLRSIFECLAETAACHELIDELASTARAARVERKSLVVHYGDPRESCRTLSLGPPFEGRAEAYVPGSYLRLALETNGIVFNTRTYGETRYLQWSGLSPMGEIPMIDRGYALSDRGPGPQLAPITVWGGWVVYDPTLRTKLDEPALCSYTFGKRSAPLTVSLGLPGALLRLLAQEILHDGEPLWPPGS